MDRLWLPALCLLLAACGGTQTRKITTHSITLPEKLPADRREADKVARDAFSKLTFFAEGRGTAMIPGLIGVYDKVRWTHAFDKMLRDKWGLILEGQEIVGVSEVEYNKQRIGAAGCAICHSGRAAGQTVVALGNKRFDIVQLASQLNKLQHAYVAITPANEERRKLEKRSLDFIGAISDRTHGNLTQGLVPVAFVRKWFFDVAGEPFPADYPRGAVKVPQLWGYKEKHEVGLFCDACGHGKYGSSFFGVDLAAGQTPEALTRLRPEARKAEKVLDAILPPAYPFAIDQARAMRGAKVFAQNCRECHGSYARDGEGLPVFQKPRLIPHDEILTDPDRLNMNNDAYSKVAARNPYREVYEHNPPYRGYIAPRLEGIWCRFPYLHNAAVPNVAALLTPSAQRPVVFSMKDAGERNRFDESLLGLTLPDERERGRLLKLGAKGERSVYDTRRVGQSNTGHDFGTDLSDEAKASLIEYLKTL